MNLIFHSTTTWFCWSLSLGVIVQDGDEYYVNPVQDYGMGGL